MLDLQAQLEYLEEDLVAANTTTALPVCPELTEEMQAYVVEKIVQFYA